VMESREEEVRSVAGTVCNSPPKCRCGSHQPPEQRKRWQ
jgi:hypothetical protein